MRTATTPPVSRLQKAAMPKVRRHSSRVAISPVSRAATTVRVATSSAPTIPTTSVRAVISSARAATSVRVAISSVPTSSAPISSVR